MLNKDVYAIYTSDDEYSGSVKELYDSFEEAKKDRHKYANWFCPKGDVRIKLFKANAPFRCCHTWRIRPDGTIECEFDF